MEGLRWSLPIGTLHIEEHGESQGSRQSQNEVLGLGAKNWSHQWVRQQPSSCEMQASLGGELLQLVDVEFLHLDDLPFA